MTSCLRSSERPTKEASVMSRRKRWYGRSAAGSGSSIAVPAPYVGRAGRGDAGGAARLVAHGEVVAVFVSPVHGGGGPAVMGLRAVRLAEPADVDTTVLLASLSDRFARIISGGLVGPDAPV